MAVGGRRPAAGPAPWGLFPIAAPKVDSGASWSLDNDRSASGLACMHRGALVAPASILLPRMENLAAIL